MKPETAAAWLRCRRRALAGARGLKLGPPTYEALSTRRALAGARGLKLAYGGPRVTPIVAPSRGRVD